MPTNRRGAFAGLLIVALLLALTGFYAARAAARSGWQEKVDSWVLEAVAADAPVSYLILLHEQADLGDIDPDLTKEERGEFVYERLTAVARRTQPPLLAALGQAGADFRPYWISNMIWARSDGTVVEMLARRSDVARIYANPWTKLDTLGEPQLAPLSKDVPSNEWNLELIGAPAVWAADVTGRGAVIGGQDTGYDWQHPALLAQYRGWDGQTADHTYSWHDAIHENNPNTADGNSCGFDVAAPCDDRGHGTHTMGIMAGTDGADNVVGVAPGAQWIGCRNMEEGWGTPATYAECYEWFVAPYPSGSDPFEDGDPAKAPHVINNSWGCPVSEGCTDPDVLRGVVENVRAAGIVTVNSASNHGPACGTVVQPASIYEASFTVGATGADDQIAFFSSRGPANQDGVGILKPDISAPGASIRSTLPNARYGLLSGTSMAAPHVAGLVALLIDARPDLAGDVSELESLIQQSALPRYSDEGCGGDTPSSLPNHTYGWGRIDALAALQAADALPTPAPEQKVFVPIWIAP